jgi:ribosomal protein S18 acetylase RimI-like enzyme
MIPAQEWTVDAHPAPTDVQFLEDQINAFNVAQTGISGEGDILLSIMLRDDAGQISAGVYGWTWGGCCEIRCVWVRPELRGQGYGRSLLQAAEQEARRRGCGQVVLDTHSFQAPGFYQKLGYEIVGVVDEYPRGHKKYYLKKQLG